MQNFFRSVFHSEQRSFTLLPVDIQALREEMFIPHYWKVLLDGYGEVESGDVITKDGEIIGTWSLVDDVFYTFTPDGEEDYLFFDPFLGLLCCNIAEWHAEKEAAQGVLGVAQTDG
ncbi:hypothetical protein [Pseudochrobactrum asaccharolyticum]|nr:hypothetical protein [Pseudochrobactrum asaccharolyticum]MBX8800540.1 hypothetical protein [Ochrobactrum sp. MR28]MBX8816144.1 hypothetical protein [Ochrobactrum sp. MR31]